MKPSTLAALTVPAALAAAFFYQVNLPKQPVPGTEQSHTGVVVDRAMSTVDDRPFFPESRPYLGLELEDGSGFCFWEGDVFDIPAGVSIGDRVRVYSAIEDDTGLLILTHLEPLAPST